MRLKNKLDQVGDTIVEVMIAVAVLGLTLGTAYATASRSLKVSRQAQERGEALKLAEGQVESLKALAVQGDIFVTGQVFCVNGGVRKDFPPTYGSTSVKVLASDTFGEYPNPECISDSGLYHIAIDANAVGNRYIFNVNVRWDSLGSSLRDQVVMKYVLVKAN